MGVATRKNPNKLSGFREGSAIRCSGRFGKSGPSAEFEALSLFRATRQPVLTSYPWTHQQLAGLRPGLGPLSARGRRRSVGLQFVLSREGFEVHNVDPFFEHWTVKGMDPVGEHDRLNHVFGTDVVLHRATLPEADLHGQLDRGLLRLDHRALFAGRG